MDNELRARIVEGSVPEDATFGEAADELRRSEASAIAVLGEDGTVVGLFGELDLLAGLCPTYLGELRHTAFLPEDLGALVERAEGVATQPVKDFMRSAPIVDLDTSSLHLAELFLHTDVRTLAVVDGGKFVGMFRARDLCDLLSRRLPQPEG